MRLAEYSSVFIVSREAATTESDGSNFIDWVAVIPIIIIGRTLHKNFGSKTCIRFGNRPNWSTIVMTLIKAKNFPIQPARSWSFGMAELSFATKITFSNAAKPWEASTSKKSAQRVGTRRNNLDAFVNNPSCWVTCDFDTLDFSPDSSCEGLNPNLSDIAYARDAAIKLRTIIKPVPKIAPANPSLLTIKDTFIPATAEVIEVSPEIGANHRELCSGFNTLDMKDQYWLVMS
mmetsp:Transcript_29492/g.43559  ORF Transcript_29492/g.43559 Transcript_29492/m.43559 type:complete len:232 (-) Transcript_29492:690-1385(-)